ncbi:MAG: MtrAB system histidine kinase MtrB [Dermatophilaceae bacterium]
MDVVASLRRAGAAGPSRLRRSWRRSLMFRVVATTLLLGLMVLGLLGTYLYRQIGEGLVDERRAVASAEALQLTKRAQLQFNSTDLVDSQERLTTAARGIVQEQAGTERSRYVVLARLDTNRSAVTVPEIRSGEVGLADIPTALQDQVAADASTQHEQIVQIRLSGQLNAVAAWVVGQQIELPRAGLYGIYFVYPMERERDSLAVVGRTFLLGGLVLIVLIGVIAYVVTRLVVTPVRSAAVVAERLASGHLDERMVAHGEDDLATLATSFNEMADGLERQIGQLEDLSRLQQRFVSDVSHELRTPLTTIRMAADLIHDGRAEFSPAVARSAELLQAELDRFEALLSDLLEISRFDAGAAVLDVEPTDVRRSVTRVVDACQALADRRGSRMTMIDPGHPCEAVVDTRRVERILRNLVVNAIEHGEGRPVEIRVDDNDTAVAVSVRDFGLGLRPGEAAMVFNRFWRADPARARTSGGTGLGLAIALEDARLHSGWLQAWGAPGEGSCFRLTLPRSADVAIDRAPLGLEPTPMVTPGVLPVTAQVPAS